MICIPSKRNWVKHVSLALALVLGTPLVVAAQEANKEGSLDSELRTMSRVIEESLDESALRDWQGTSVGTSFFEPKVRAQYIPTVGAVFTLSVNFPIVEPEEVEENIDDEEPATDDLWERVSRRRGPRNPGRRTQRNFSGVGLQLRSGEDGEAKVHAVMNGTGAEEAGIKADDIVIEVDDESVENLELSEIANRIKGSEGTKVHLKIRRPSTDGDLEILDFEVERRQISVDQSPNWTPRFGQTSSELFNGSRRLAEADVLLRLADRQLRDRGRNRRNISVQLFDDPKIVSVNGYLQRLGMGPGYDEKKVASLRETLIETVATYGHRMEHLDKSERILLVVNAPKPATLNRGTKYWPGAFTVSGIIAPGNTRSVHSLRLGSGSADHMMISIDVKDLDGKRTFEELEKRVSETRY